MNESRVKNEKSKPYIFIRKALSTKVSYIQTGGQEIYMSHVEIYHISRLWRQSSQ